MDRHHQAIVDFIREYRRTEKRWPMSKEIARALPDLGCERTIRYYIGALEQMGVLQRPGRGRYGGIRLLAYEARDVELALRCARLEDEQVSLHSQIGKLRAENERLEAELAEARHRNTIQRSIIAKMRVRPTRPGAGIRRLAGEVLACKHRYSMWGWTGRPPKPNGGRS